MGWKYGPNLNVIDIHSKKIKRKGRYGKKDQRKEGRWEARGGGQRKWGREGEKGPNISCVDKVKSIFIHLCFLRGFMEAKNLNLDTSKYYLFLK